MVESQPEDATSEPTGHCRNTAPPPLSTIDDSPPQGSDPVLPETTQACRWRRRMKRADEINVFTMRAYYKLTTLETDFTDYRDPASQNIHGEVARKKSE